MQEIVWSIEWEKKLGTIERVHPTKRSDLMMPYACLLYTSPSPRD